MRKIYNYNKFLNEAGRTYHIDSDIKDDLKNKFQIDKRLV